MKQVLLIITILLFGIEGRSQELMVKSFQEVISDISARTSPRKDINGNDCALVKVRLAAEGARFKGGVVGDVSYDTSEYYVYLSPASKVLTVTAPNYLPLDVPIQQYINTLTSKTTYYLTIGMDSGSTKINEVNQMDYFALTVSPVNASVWVDGELQTLDSNGEMIALLGQGLHTYKVEAKGYMPIEKTFTISGGKISMSEMLTSIMASLEVECETEGCEISINSVKKNSNKWSGSLAAGTYMVEVTKDGYKPYKQSLSLTENENRKIAVPSLDPIVGMLDVSYKPIDANIFVDGEYIGGTPNIIKGIVIGKHSIVISKQGYITQSLIVDVREGETSKIEGNLKQEIEKESLQERKVRPEDVVVYEIDYDLSNLEYVESIMDRYNGSSAFAKLNESNRKRCLKRLCKVAAQKGCTKIKIMGQKNGSGMFSGFIYLTAFVYR